MYHFFAYMARMKLIRRWSLMKSVTDENIAEHSAQVAQIAHALALIRNRMFDGKLDADRIAVIEDGTVTACAPHDELMKISSAYRDIYYSQMKNGGGTHE